MLRLSIECNYQFLNHWFPGVSDEYQFAIVTVKSEKRMNTIFDDYDGHIDALVGKNPNNAVTILVKTHEELWKAVDFIGLQSIINIQFSHAPMKFTTAIYGFGATVSPEYEWYSAIWASDLDDPNRTVHRSMAADMMNPIEGVHVYTSNYGTYLFRVDDPYLLTAVLMVLPDQYQVVKVVPRNLHQVIQIPDRYRDVSKLHTGVIYVTTDLQ